jgi:hypothetical protein
MARARVESGHVGAGSAVAFWAVPAGLLPDPPGEAGAHQSSADSIKAQEPAA